MVVWNLSCTSPLIARGVPRDMWRNLLGYPGILYLPDNYPDWDQITPTRAGANQRETPSRTRREPVANPPFLRSNVSGQPAAPSAAAMSRLISPSSTPRSVAFVATGTRGGVDPGAARSSSFVHQRYNMYNTTQQHDVDKHATTRRRGRLLACLDLPTAIPAHSMWQGACHTV